MAHAVGADVVVVHPPFRWQKEYAARLRRRHRGPRGVDRHRLRGREHVPVAGLARAGHGDVPARLGPLRARPTPTPRSTSPTPRSRSPTRSRWPQRLGDRLRHIHLTDGTGSAKDEHLVPGPRHDRTPPASCAHLAAHRLRRPHRARDQHPQVRHAARSASSTCSSRWSSPASTSRSRRTAVDCPRRRRARAAAGARVRPTPAPRSWRAARKPFAAQGLRAVRRSGRSPRPPGSTRPWCTTTSAPRTTSSSPRWSCRSTRAW